VHFRPYVRHRTTGEYRAQLAFPVGEPSSHHVSNETETNRPGAKSEAKGVAELGSKDQDSDKLKLLNAQLNSALDGKCTPNVLRESDLDPQFSLRIHPRSAGKSWLPVGCPGRFAYLCKEDTCHRTLAITATPGLEWTTYGQKI